MTHLCLFQFICKVPVTYCLIHSFQFINFVFIIGKFCREANQLFEKALKMGTINEDFDALFSIFCELNASTKLLSSSFGIFLLASIAAQFVVSLKLFYTLFLSFNGFIKFSFFLVSSTLFWIAFQFATVFMYIAGCEKFQKELTSSSKFLCRLQPARFEEHEKVNLI